MKPLMVDLFSGLEGASAAMRERGWRVVSVELQERFCPTVVADVRHLPLRDGLAPDLLWASPPCDEFTKADMPWRANGWPPSVELFSASIEAVRRLRPRFWVIENVRGALPWVRPILGPHAARIGPLMLWGRLPMMLLAQPPKPWKWRMTPAPDRAERRAKIPYEVSLAMAEAVEASLESPRRSA